MSQDPGPAAPSLRIAVLADDLIWATRLAESLERSGGTPVRLRTAEALDTSLATLDGTIVDLTSRAYDGLDALRSAAAAGVPAIAVGQHDDAPLRRAAKDAGASRVFAYRALFEHGDRELSGWLAALGAAREEQR